MREKKPVLNRRLAKVNGPSIKRLDRILAVFSFLD